MLETPGKTLVTTMGGQAQVVTFALDWFLARDEPIGEVIVLHLSPDDPRVHKALDQLAAEFAGDYYAQAARPIYFRPMPVCDECGPLADIRDETAAEATWQAVYRLVADLKTQKRTLHVCIAGGRRIMGLMAMSAAMLHFGHQDRLWHLYTPDELRKRAFEGAVMHAGPEDGVRLIQVPIAPLGAYFPGLQALARPAATSDEVMRGHIQAMDEVERGHCQAIYDRLTPRPREVLRALAQGLTPQEVAESLNIALKTVDTHKTAILTECRNEWTLADAHKLDYHFLEHKFGPFFYGTA